jgi:ABC-2 type transport system ATP-binding protein
MGNAITVRGLKKSYGDFAAVKGIDFDVAEGECFGILGPNGAGKTTTVEMLEGYRKRTAGEVSVLGVDPADGDAKWRARLGMVLQTSRPSEELTVDEVVRHFATFFDNPRDTDEVISLVGLNEKADVRAGKLSGGQQRRLDVALGIIGRPDLLFLDEPTTGFDPEARRQFWSLIEDLKKSGTTIVLTTHYLDEAEALADRVAVIAAGEIKAMGDPATLGGRASAASIVRWQEDGETKSLASDTPTKTVAELGSRFGGEVPGLTIGRPSLEDIYLELIGSNQ